MAEIFKIVHLVDLNEVEPIPYKWEEDGIVYWPKTKKECRKKQSDVHSEPDKQNWIKLNGVVKGVERIYRDAVKAADLYADLSTDEADDLRRTKRTKVSNNASEYLQFFEQSEAMSDSSSQNLKEYQSIDNRSHCQQNNDSVHVEDLIITNDVLTNEPASIISDLTFVNTTDISKIIELLSELKTSVTIIQHQVTGLQQQVAEVRVKQDHFETLLSKPVVYNQRDHLLSLHDRGKIFPLDSIDALDLFEQQLSSDELYKSEILEHWKCIIGTNCKWKIAAYKLSGFLFTTKLLAKYSWTGVSRLTEAKETFQKLIEVLHFFYLVIKNADASFTIADRDHFFKNKVLKYGQSRLNPRKRSTIRKKIEANVLQEAEFQEGTEQENNEAEEQEQNGAAEHMENE